MAQKTQSVVPNKAVILRMATAATAKMQRRSGVVVEDVVAAAAAEGDYTRGRVLRALARIAAG